MKDIADAADLLLTARDLLLRELLPALSKEHRYAAWMVANVMAIAAREQQTSSNVMRGESRRLRNLFVEAGLSHPADGADEASDLPALRRTLCRAIRAGYFDDSKREAALLDHLRHTARDWVAISNPKALRSADIPS